MEPKNFEQMKNPEKKEYTSKIELDFFRHSIKEKSDKPDEEIDITKEGVELAASKALEGTNVEQSLAFGSPRVRSQETAAYVMAGKKMEETPEAKEVIDVLNKELKVGSKVGEDENLDFHEDPSTEYYKLVNDAFGKGILMKFLVEESDELAKKNNDNITWTYSRSAGQIAEIIEKYLKIAPRWNDLVEDKTKKYEDTLKRFMGSHQSIGESFLAKLIEKTESVEARDKFVQMLNNKGFDFVEGFKVEILTTNDGSKIKVHYENKNNKENPFVLDKEISKDLLDEIIEEGKN